LLALRQSQSLFSSRLESSFLTLLQSVSVVHPTAVKKADKPGKNPELLKWCEKQRGEMTWDEFARLGHVTKGGSLKRQVQTYGTLALDTALWLAAATTTDPTWLLTLGGKPEEAKLIQRLYGTPRSVPVPTAERAARSLAQVEQALSDLRQQVEAALGRKLSSSQEHEAPTESPQAEAGKPHTRAGRSRGVPKVAGQKKAG
jgi:hypothetical protein